MADARAFAYDADLVEEEEWAFRRRLAYDYADAVRRGTAGGGGFPQPALGPASLGVARGGRPGLSRRERAARALRALSSWAIRGPRAVEHIDDLATTHQIDRENALVFACLLHLADRDDQAEVLWQFSAGAGKPASAECLYLMHIVRGELQQARKVGAPAGSSEVCGGASSVIRAALLSPAGVDGAVARPSAHVRMCLRGRTEQGRLNRDARRWGTTDTSAR